jgi:predicted regulator of Ras-like GTPase activity (Roadblock/LC7/MglB family)
MDFKAVLKTIVDESPDSLGVVIMGYDGIAIDEHLRAGGGVDVQMLAVEYASILKEIKRTVEVLKTGELEEVSIMAKECSILVRGISDDFFVALVLGAGGNFGKGRYLLKRETSRLRESLR